MTRARTTKAPFKQPRTSTALAPRTALARYREPMGEATPEPISEPIENRLEPIDSWVQPALPHKVVLPD